jgi:hypothetical protein
MFNIKKSKRVSPRAKPAGGVLVKIGAQEIPGLLDDVSMNGASIRADAEMELDKNYHFELTVEPWPVFKLEGKIVWRTVQSDERRFGVQFEPMRTYDKIRLQEMILINCAGAV